MGGAEQQVLDWINHDYSNTTFVTCLYDLFCHQDEAAKKYIKVGRRFWHYDSEKMKWRKLTVTYIRADAMFFTFEDEPDAEHAWFMGSMNALMLHAAEIYPCEISGLLSKWYPDNNLAEIFKQCKWDDCDGKITVEVIWD